MKKGKFLSLNVHICCQMKNIKEIKENGLALINGRNKRYPSEIMTDADFTDDQALLPSTPAQAESQLHSMEEAASSRVTYPYINMGNVHRMFITYIHKTLESRNTKNTYDFLVQVLNFLLPFEFKDSSTERERHNLSMLIFFIWTPPIRVLPATRPLAWLRRASESRPFPFGV